MKKLRLRKFKWFSNGHPAKKWWSEDSNSDSLTPNHRVREDRKIFKWSTRHMTEMECSPENQERCLSPQTGGPLHQVELPGHD